MAVNKQLLAKLIRITDIFEKEIIIFVYYSMFTVISYNESIFNMQFLFFGIGTTLQIYLKLKRKLYLWNNFVACSFFILGSLFSHDKNLLFIGFLSFIFSISLFSFLYEKYFHFTKQALLANIFHFIYSATVLTSFPVLYFIFMKNKLNIDLREFFADRNHLIVFSGYFVFYLLLLLNKQLLAIQTVLFKKDQ